MLAATGLATRTRATIRERLLRALQFSHRTNRRQGVTSERRLETCAGGRNS